MKKVAPAKTNIVLGEMKSRVEGEVTHWGIIKYSYIYQLLLVYNHMTRISQAFLFLCSGHFSSNKNRSRKYKIQYSSNVRIEGKIFSKE